MFFVLFFLSYPASFYKEWYRSEQTGADAFFNNTYFYEPEPSPKPYIDIETVYDKLKQYLTPSPSPTSTLPYYYGSYSYFPDEVEWKFENDCGTFYGLYTNKDYYEINITNYFSNKENTQILNSECEIFGEFVEKEYREVHCNTTLMTLKSLEDIKYKCKYVSDTCIFDKRCNIV